MMMMVVICCYFCCYSELIFQFSNQCRLPREESLFLGCIEQRRTRGSSRIRRFACGEPQILSQGYSGKCLLSPFLFHGIYCSLSSIASGSLSVACLLLLTRQRSASSPLHVGRYGLSSSNSACGMSNMVATGPIHMRLFNFKSELIKIKLELEFFSPTNHISSMQ